MKLEDAAGDATVEDHRMRTSVNEFGETICNAPQASRSAPSQRSGEMPAAIGRYRLERLIGQGAFGDVYKGHDEQLERAVAVKVQRVATPAEADGESFLREARHLAQLRHPNIVAVHDAGLEDGVYYLVSEFLAGLDLNEWIRDHEPDWRESVRVVAALADALADLHAHGVVHRDVKPANIIMTDRVEGWTPVLVDFGLALSEAFDGGVGAKRGDIAGTPNFMSPEQASGGGHRIDGRTDIYALGVVLYRMLSGKLPFQGANLTELLTEVIEDEPRPPRQFAPHLPRELEQICLRAMAKRITDRYTTAGDLAEDLRAQLAFARGGDQDAVEPTVVVRPVADPKQLNPDEVLRILIAEDNDVTRTKLKGDLERWGHIVSEAEDGEVAWKLFQKGEYSIVITDWVMPNMDGLQLVQRVRGSERGQYVYVIMLTARAEKHDIVAGMGAGADDFLAKPFHRDELNVRLRAGSRIARMTRKLAETNRRLLRGLDAAGKIQQSYLPSATPDIPGVEFAWVCQPCDQLGGDMLNVIQLDEHTIGLYVLDVSGHGVPASLLATSISRLLAPAHDVTSLLFSRGDHGEERRVVEPDECARQLNQQFATSSTSGQFFTLVYGLLDTRRREFRYTSAGHPPVIRVRRDGRIELLEAFGLPLGVAPESDDFHREVVQLDPGDRLFLYSNGLTNTADHSGELFGLQRFLGCLEGFAEAPLAEVTEGVLAALGSWHEGTHQSDDVSLLAVSV